MAISKKYHTFTKLFFCFLMIFVFSTTIFSYTDSVFLVASELREEAEENKDELRREKSERIEKKTLKKKKDKKKEAKKEKYKKKEKQAKKQKKAAKKKVYLTFDDGPSENTVEVLKILDKYKVKATFFVIGREDKKSLETYKDIVAKGHTIALHSYTHNYKQIYKSLSAFKKDYKRISDLVFKATGVRSNYYRFPGGSSNTVSPISMKVFVDYFNEQGIKYFDWNVQCGDAVKYPPSPQKLYENVVNAISARRENSFIVLIHDSKPMKNSVKALPSIIKWLKKNQYDILPIDDDTIPVHHSIAKKR